MEDLLKLIDSLRERIRSHQVALQRNEALTRSVLIDPLLRALGWNTEDPTQVMPEFRIPSERDKRADYALFAHSDVPVVIVEAKRLGESLTEAASQAAKYCTLDGYESFAVTDGRQWTLYGTRRPGALEEKKIARFDLGSDSPVDVCSMAISLWRQRFVEGASALARPLPVPEVVADVSALQQPSVVSTSAIESDLPSDWISLPRLAPDKGEKPRELRLPTGEITRVTEWAQLVTKLTQWLVDQGHLSEANLPISTGGKKYVVAAQPEHSDGTLFSGQQHRAGRFYVETKFGRADHVRNMQAIIERAGQQASDFAVRTKKPEQSVH